MPRLTSAVHFIRAASAVKGLDEERPFWHRVGMPCTDGRDYEIGDLQKALDKATRVACEALALIEGTKSLKLGAKLSMEAYVWWGNHKKADAERLRQEREGRLDRIASEIEDFVEQSKLFPNLKDVTVDYDENCVVAHFEGSIPEGFPYHWDATQVMTCVVGKPLRKRRRK